MSESIGKYVDIEDLTEWEDNPRVNDHAVKDVAASIKRFGFASPIIARKENGEIIAGHTRYKAAKELGLDRVPVRFVDLDPVDSKLLALADNRISEESSWDPALLKDVFEKLDKQNVDLSLSGFHENEIRLFLEKSEPSASGATEIDQDSIDLANKCPRCNFEF